MVTADQPVPRIHGDLGNRAAVASMTVLYDAGCRLCRTARRWLESREQLVPLEFVAAGSSVARCRFPQLNPAATLRDLTVVTDGGLVYTGDGAWLVVLWALARYRSSAERLAQPALLPLARRMIAAAAAVRERDLARYGGRDVPEEDGVTCADGCR
jgi:predicted DCC family thiol-disulfide oxidoreductase YuxK